MTTDPVSPGKRTATGLALLAFLLAMALAIGFTFGRYSLRRASDLPLPAKAVVASRPAPSEHGDGASLSDWLSAFVPNTDTNDAPQEIDPVASYEDLMYAQPDRVDAQIRNLRPQTPGKVDLYAIGFAGDGEENVFRNEVDYLSKLLAKRFGAEGRTVQLINSPQTFDRTALAMRTNLYDALSGVAAKMDTNEDILLLFLTSHGSRDHQLYVQMGAMPLDQLTPEDIRDALDKSKIRWRVIVVSACFSGGFIPALREPHTMIITAARSDRTSFGCGNDSKITWFGKAFLTEALNQTTDFHDAYLRARKTIAKWEQRDHETPSEPQFWKGALIEAKLVEWRATLPPSSAPVPFVPISVASRTQGAAR